jgi:hypothetical protein
LRFITKRQYVRDKRRMLAWWLLLLLVRVLTPEATLLRLHTHQHTTEAVLSRPLPRHEHRFLLTPQHRHCHVEQLYDAPFQLAELGPPMAGPELRAYARYRVQQMEVCPLHLLDGACLRGPPMACSPFLA